LKTLPPNDAAASREVRNIVRLEIYQILARMGWILKTETVIMPAVLDALVDSGTLRGLLPILNRGGHSLPPLLIAGTLARLPRKRAVLCITMLLMASCFAVLAAAWGPLAATRPDRLASVFLVSYTAFCIFNGLNNLILATLQGKLVTAGNRGRAMLVSATAGSVLAIGAAIFILGPWIAAPGGFPRIFGATAFFFGLAAIVPPLLEEPVQAVPARAAKHGWVRRLRAGMAGWQHTLAADPVLTRFACVVICFSAVLMLSPHYQAFARDSLGTSRGDLLGWVVAQNVTMALATLVAGPLADRLGTRIVLIWLFGLSSLTPLVVLFLSLLPKTTAAEWFWLVYVPLGLNPLTMRIFTGYALELAPSPTDHPRYVSVIGGALAVPFVLSPLVGFSVDAVGFGVVFIAGTAVILAGAIVAISLPEPRALRLEHVRMEDSPGL